MQWLEIPQGIQKDQRDDKNINFQLQLKICKKKILPWGVQDEWLCILVLIFSRNLLRPTEIVKIKTSYKIKIEIKKKTLVQVNILIANMYINVKKLLIMLVVQEQKNKLTLLALRTCSFLVGSNPDPVHDTKIKSVSCPV